MSRMQSTPMLKYNHNPSNLPSFENLLSPILSSDTSGVSMSPKNSIQSSVSDGGVNFNDISTWFGKKKLSVNDTDRFDFSMLLCPKQVSSYRVITDDQLEKENTAEETTHRANSSFSLDEALNKYECDSRFTTMKSDKRLDKTKSLIDISSREDINNRLPSRFHKVSSCNNISFENNPSDDVLIKSRLSTASGSVSKHFLSKSDLQTDSPENAINKLNKSLSSQDYLNRIAMSCNDMYDIQIAHKRLGENSFQKGQTENVNLTKTNHENFNSVITKKNMKNGKQAILNKNFNFETYQRENINSTKEIENTSRTKKNNKQSSDRYLNKKLKHINSENKENIYFTPLQEKSPCNFSENVTNETLDRNIAKRGNYSMNINKIDKNCKDIRKQRRKTLVQETANWSGTADNSRSGEKLNKSSNILSSTLPRMFRTPPLQEKSLFTNSTICKSQHRLDKNSKDYEGKSLDRASTLVSVSSRSNQNISSSSDPIFKPVAVPMRVFSKLSGTLMSPKVYSDYSKSSELFDSQKYKEWSCDSLNSLLSQDGVIEKSIGGKLPVQDEHLFQLQNEIDNILHKLKTILATV